MTLAKKAFYLSSAVLLAGAMGVAQSSMSTPQDQDQDSSAASQAAGAKLRGCLSGSDGNYTLTDHNGTIYHLVGDDAQLSGSVGHEVEISGTPDAQRSSASDMSGNTASSFQVTGAREIATRCEHGSSTGTMGTDSQPMTERPPTTDHQPKGAPGEGTPPPEPQPHMMAMLQQPGATDMGSQSGNSQTTSSPSSTSQSPENGSMANTPVTSQTPAESPSPTGTNSQLGSGTTNPSAVSAQPAQTETPTTPQAGTTTPEPGATTTPQAGTTSTTGSNPAAGENNANTGAGATSGATTNPDMNANPAPAGNPAATATPQSTQNDQNKPLYERQATDIPWASHSGANSGAITTTTTTNPDGSSTTTTTTNPQSPTTPQPQTTPEPH